MKKNPIHARYKYNDLNPYAWYNRFYSKPSYEIRMKKGSRKMVKKKKKDYGLPF